MPKEKVKKILFYSLIIFFGLGLTLLLWLFLSNQSSSEPWTKKLLLILRPFIIGGVIAYIMKGTCNFFDRVFYKGLIKSGKREAQRAKKLASVLSIVVTYIIWIAAVSALVAVIIEPMIESLKSLIDTLFTRMPEYVDRATAFVHKKLENYPDIQQLFESAIESLSGKFENWIETELPSKAEQIGTALISGALDMVVLIKDIFIGLVVSCLLLVGRKRLAEKSKILIRCIFKDNAADAVIEEFRFADKMFSGFLEGKVIDSAIIGVIYYIALLIMKAPYAPLIAVICGVTNIIPIFGPFLGAIPSALIILTESPITVVYFVIFVCIMQFIDGNIIDPHIVGNNIKMSGLSVLFAVILFGGLWGFAGLLVGVPVFAVLYDIIKKIVRHILKKKNKEYLLSSLDSGSPQKKKRKNKKDEENTPATATASEQKDGQTGEPASEYTDKD